VVPISDQPSPVDWFRQVRLDFFFEPFACLCGNSLGFLWRF
jgi:hypothetical protein